MVRDMITWNSYIHFHTGARAEKTTSNGRIWEVPAPGSRGFSSWCFHVKFSFLLSLSSPCSCPLLQDIFAIHHWPNCFRISELMWAYLTEFLLDIPNSKQSSNAYFGPGTILKSLHMVAHLLFIANFLPVLCPFLRYRNWGTDQLSNLAGITQLASSKARIQVGWFKSTAHIVITMLHFLLRKHF